MITIRRLRTLRVWPVLLFCLISVTFSLLGSLPEVRNGFAASAHVSSNAMTCGLRVGYETSLVGVEGELSSLFLPETRNATRNPWPCLPHDVRPEEVVSASRAKAGTGSAKIIKVTVSETLKTIGAKCRKGKLIDTAGKQIHFYRMKGCWGNPPQEYQEILGRQRSELEALRKRYHVVEITCNPWGVPIP